MFLVVLPEYLQIKWLLLYLAIFLCIMLLLLFFVVRGIRRRRRFDQRQETIDKEFDPAFEPAPALDLTHAPEPMSDRAAAPEPVAVSEEFFQPGQPTYQPEQAYEQEEPVLPKQDSIWGKATINERLLQMKPTHKQLYNFVKKMLDRELFNVTGKSYEIYFHGEEQVARLVITNGQTYLFVATDPLPLSDELYRHKELSSLYGLPAMRTVIMVKNPANAERVRVLIERLKLSGFDIG